MSAAQDLNMASVGEGRQPLNPGAAPSKASTSPPGRFGEGYLSQNATEQPQMNEKAKEKNKGKGGAEFRRLWCALQARLHSQHFTSSTSEVRSP